MKKILLLGDSIRIGYDKYVKMSFENEAEVYYPADNCRFTTYTIRRLDDWVKELQLGDGVDLVHWNCGLWDVLRLVDDKCAIPLEFYKVNIDRICSLLKHYFPKAKFVFATSTPVQEHLFGELRRLNSDTEMYNAAAVEIVKAHGMEVNDLYALLKGCPAEYYTDSTHLYTKAGTEVITDKVIGIIENTLDIKGKKLDYEALFAAQENVIGI